MQAFYLGYREKGKFVSVINTHALLIIIRIVERHIRIFTKHTIRAKTHNGKPTDENEIGVKLAALNIKDSAKYKEILFSRRKYKKEKLVL
jgi:hypothetical protein